MSTQAAASPFAFDRPDDAVAALRDRLQPVETESIPLDRAAGRALAEAIATDRPSPACDVSAMDGYAVRLDDINATTLPVNAAAEPGSPPPAMPTGAAIKIFTGAPVPAEADAVIPREQVDEHPQAIGLPAGMQIKPGQHIRRRGENAPVGQAACQPGHPITPPTCAAAASFGYAHLKVFRTLKTSAIITGNELLSVSATPEPWQLRDSNGPTLAAMFSPLPWIDWQGDARATDDPQALREQCEQALSQCDALILTGAVSMGDHDHVPDVLRSLGCKIVFHKLPIRPGKPVLGAVGPGGQAVLGLPGNPVSVMVTARTLAAAVLRHRAGLQPESPTSLVTLTNPDDKQLHLHWSRPVRLVEPGQAELIDTRGSGDIVSPASSHGFITIPPNQTGPGPWPFHSWQIGAPS